MSASAWSGTLHGRVGGEMLTCCQAAAAAWVYMSHSARLAAVLDALQL
jgi:hypothetical protein